MSTPTSSAPLVAGEADKALTFAQPQQLSLDDLDGDHHHLLVCAIMRVLSTELAEVTYAQIIDGLPTGDVAYEAYGTPYAGHPIDQAHNELCPGMLDKARQFRDDLRPEMLVFDSQVGAIPGPLACRQYLPKVGGG